MEDFISRSVESFSKFLSNHQDVLKNSKLTSRIISYIIPCDHIKISGKVDEILNNSERSFYFENPESDFIIIANDEIMNITENGESRFAATDKKVREWKDKIVSNHEIIKSKRVPLFIGAMKFMVEHSDNDWKDFSDSTWFVPKIMFLRTDNKQFLIFNFLYNSNTSIEYILKNFQIKLEHFSGITENISSLPKIRKMEGNSPKDKKKWKQLIDQALESIENGQVNKVVLARKVEFLLSGEMNFEKVMSRFRSDYNTCYSFIYHFGKSFFFGATPEILAKFSEGKVQFDALAGSAPRGKNEKEDKEFEIKLLTSEKNKAEHNFVIEHIKNALSSVCEEIAEKEKFKIKKLSNIQHLQTVISAELKPECSLFSVIKEIYPTPAICGSPQNEALHFIKKHENFRRGLYSGIIGWFNLQNEGDFVVALRSALNYGNRLIAYAGSGIVKNSVADPEFAETELKLKPIMSLFKE
jgi:menaquinone-specific isochorismate synthase